jgi:Na+-transporting NADH:ubiquinone oxidoreductase subunit NqrB
MNERLARELRDPRWVQIASLLGLLVYGATALDFEIRLDVVAAILGTAFGTQLVASRGRGIPFDPRSAAISSLSLCLLLRTPSLATAAAAAAIAIGSKFAIRVRGKHVFNPTALGIAAALAFANDAWVSAGQWGTAPLLVLWIVGLGSLVLRRARRGDVTWAFLGCYLAALFGRALWLGDPFAVPLHAMQSGAFWIFAFFMVSDPRTTPDSRAGRVAFAAAVAALALALRYGFYQTDALIWSLVLCAPLTPLLDRWRPGKRFAWGGLHTIPESREGDRHASEDALGPVRPGLTTAV